VTPAAQPPGVLVVDKPRGITSHDVVARVRRERGQRAGHAGTLDPFATGLLIVLVGREATRCAPRFVALPKTYRAVARFGATSTTGDPEGEIIETGALPPEDLSLPTGSIRQRPPAHSAVKVRGVRAYRRARRGEEIELPERIVTIHRFEQLWRRGERAQYEIECSSGTYIRSLIAGLGDAYCEALRRIAVGPFSLEDAGALIPLTEALERIRAAPGGPRNAGARLAKRG
jgi:tRNA pseudouridine55 synthase